MTQCVINEYQTRYYLRLNIFQFNQKNKQIMKKEIGFNCFLRFFCSNEVEKIDLGWLRYLYCRLKFTVGRNIIGPRVEPWGNPNILDYLFRNAINFKILIEYSLSVQLISSLLFTRQQKGFILI